MRRSHGVLRILVAGAALLAMAGSGDARTRKGDKLLAEGSKAEQRRDWGAALELYEKALAEDPSDTAYQIAARRVRFQAGQAHVDLGQKLRGQGELEKALAEFQKAYAIDPSSTIADQELRRTLETIERNKKAGAALRPEERSLTPAELEKKRELETIARLEPAPELKPLARTPLNLKMSNQPPRVLFEAVGKLAGVNVVFDPDYGSEQQAVRRNLSIELNNATLEDALDYLATMTRSFWKPLSSNAILVTQDTVPKRREYEDSVVKVFYLSNLTTPQELQEINTVVRTVTNIQKVFLYNTMNALIVRGSPDQVLLAEKLINDLDKPRAEVVVDVLVMEANRAKTRNLASTIGTLNSSGTLAAGLSSQVMFTPRNPVLFGNNQNVITTTTTDTAGNVTTVTTPISSTTTNYPYGSQYGSPYGSQYGTTSYQTGGTTNNLTNQLMSLARIAHISTNDFSVTLPGALLQAVLSDRSTRVLQSPQVRAASGQKASLRIGDRVPVASGGMQPFGGVAGGYGGGSLYNQFTFLDVGVNVDITPTVHGNGEVTLKVMLDISTVRDRVDIAGVSQPLIGQRKVEHEIRIREGEASLLGGLMQLQDTKVVSGIPGLGSIPVLKRLFTSESLEKNQSELLIVLIPHIVRTPGITELNLRPVAAGTENVTRMSLTPRAEATAPAAPAAPAAQPPAGAPPAQPQPQPVNSQPQPVPAQPVAAQPAPVAPQPLPPAQQAPPAPIPAAPTRLLFRPGSVQARSGSTFTLQLDADSARDLVAAPFHLQFDPQLLRLQEIAVGGLLSSDGQKVIFTRNILNDAGAATVNLNRLPGAGGVNGSGTLAVFTFQAIKPGATVVTFSELGARNSAMQPVTTDLPHAGVMIQ